ncbi:anti-sigma F factor antagonist [Aminipila luticellarii]|uniref:Anti-sigma F factor antagonist n=1 Tax=Aminipila luticellarii TaxID=2507160 RepID=A0A410PVS9_9FIRM|nr:anti-sigma F factor antagonist [Aminipila luticellarii]QAT43052.1 anti-sigma F factor antagonist [Aminipila luticellarii]
MQTYLDFQMKDDVLIVNIVGDLDHHQATQAREEIDRTIEAFKSKNLILDFSKVEFMDSSGIGVVMGRYNKVKEKGGEILIIGCSKYVKLILEMAGIFTIIRYCESLNEALEKFQAMEEQREVSGNDK